MDISLYRMIPPDAQDSVFVNSVSLMNVISHEIEDIVVNNRLPVDFYAGFQRFSYFQRQVKRYRRLAAVCRRVYVWGVPDVDPPTIPGVEFIPVAPDMEIAREWFLVVDTPDFFTALLTEEATYGQDMPKGQRRFRGVWTYDESLVARSYLLISQMLGQQFRPVMQRNYQRQNDYLVQISNRLVQRQDRIDQALTRSILLQDGLNRGETPMLVLDVQQVVQVASKSLADLFNMPAEDAAGQPLAAWAGGAFADLELDQSGASTNASLVGPDNQSLTAEASPVMGKLGPVGWVVTVQRPEQATTNLAPAPAPALPIAPMLQKYLGGIQQLLGMMPSLVARQDVQLRVVGQMQRLVGEMHEQVNRVSMLQQLESQSQLVTVAVQLDPLVREVVATLSLQASEQQVQMQVEIQDLLPIVHLDGEQIKLALRELLLNALRQAPQGSTVEVQALRQDASLVLRVSDTGSGLSLEQQAHIFDPLYRTDLGRGNGIDSLGLALARAVARAHGGRLDLQSVAGRGSTFTLKLPLAA
jgi:signal transduction histidine kinase